MDVVLRAAGAAVVLVVTIDVFFTVLFPASGRGPIRNPLARFLWHGFGIAGRMTTGQRGRDLLSYSGPVVIAATLSVWFLLLVVGWAMIFEPALGTGIRASSGATPTGWATALYFSGFNLTTLGVGDLVPATAAYRLLTVAAAALGFAFFSMVITYFLSVYSSLTSRNAFAQGMHHLSGNTGNAAELIARIADAGELPGAQQHLSAKADFLRETHQTHRFYPVLRYFHYREPHYALPRVLLVALDTATLIRTVLDPRHHGRVMHSPSLNGLSDAAMDLLHGLMPGVQPASPSERQTREWREQYRVARARLAGAGLHVRADHDAGAEEYVSLRSQWERPVQELAVAMLYEWGEVATSPTPT